MSLLAHTATPLQHSVVLGAQACGERFDLPPGRPSFITRVLCRQSGIGGRPFRHRARALQRLKRNTGLERRIMVTAFRHVLSSLLLKTSRPQIVASVTVRHSGGSLCMRRGGQLMPTAQKLGKVCRLMSCFGRRAGPKLANSIAVLPPS